MAEGGVVMDPDQFKCVVCLDVLQDPVTLPCGHNYCSGCIRRCWDQEQHLGFVSCPQCRQTFMHRPVLARNTLLAKVVEMLRGLREVPEFPGQSVAQADDVECDACIGRKLRAASSCLTCLASFCEAHLQPHRQSPVFSRHKLVSASRTLQQTVCPRHTKLLEVYCRTDKHLICYLCLTDLHEGHDTVLLETEVQQQQHQVGDLKLQSQLKNQQRENLAQQLNDAIFTLAVSHMTRAPLQSGLNPSVFVLQRSAEAAVSGSDAIFGELSHTLEMKRQEVKDLIQSQEMLAVSRAEQLLVQIQRDIAEQKTREAELDNLCQTTDHFLFLQNFASLQSQPDPPLPSISVDTSVCFRSVLREVSTYKASLQDVFDQRSGRIYDRVKRTKIVVSPEPDLQLSRLLIADDLFPAATGRRLGLDQSAVSPVGTSSPVGCLQLTFNPWAS